MKQEERDEITKELYEEAVRFVNTFGDISPVILQRRFMISYDLCCKLRDLIIERESLL